MSTSKSARIGFDRTIHIEWLDMAAACVSRGQSVPETQRFLYDFLEDIVPGDGHSSGRGKTLTVLTRVWLTVPDKIRPLRDNALKCLASATREERIAVHWAMVVATHPFFFDVVTNVGKFLTLHGQANRSQIKRRMTETWGDRSTLARTIQHVLKSVTQWGLLGSGSEKGSLVADARAIQVPDEIVGLLIHAVLLTQRHGMQLSQLVNHPGLFPFKLQFNAPSLRQAPNIRIHRQGDQSDFIELA